MRRAVGAKAVGIEAVIAPSNHDSIGKSHVGVGEIEQRAALGEVGLWRLFALLGLLWFPGRLARLRCLERLELGRIGEIEEARRLGQRRHAAQVADRFTGILAIPASAWLADHPKVPASTVFIRSISAFWSEVTSLVNWNIAGSYAEPCSRSRSSTMSSAPWWCGNHQLEQ